MIAFVKELSDEDRQGILDHLLTLNQADRHLRFGAVLSDEMIGRY